MNSFQRKAEVIPPYTRRPLSPAEEEALRRLEEGEWKNLNKTIIDGLIGLKSFAPPDNPHSLNLAYGHIILTYLNDRKTLKPEVLANTPAAKVVAALDNLLESGLMKQIEEKEKSSIDPEKWVGEVTNNIRPAIETLHRYYLRWLEETRNVKNESARTGSI